MDRSRRKGGSNEPGVPLRCAESVVDIRRHCLNGEKETHSSVGTGLAGDYSFRSGSVGAGRWRRLARRRKSASVPRGKPPTAVGLRSSPAASWSWPPTGSTGSPARRPLRPSVIAAPSPSLPASCHHCLPPAGGDRPFVDQLVSDRQDHRPAKRRAGAGRALGQRCGLVRGWRHRDGRPGAGRGHRAEPSSRPRSAPPRPRRRGPERSRRARQPGPSQLRASAKVGGSGADPR